MLQYRFKHTDNDVSRWETVRGVPDEIDSAADELFDATAVHALRTFDGVAVKITIELESGSKLQYRRKP